MMSIAKLSIEERTLLKTASKHYLESNQLARDFREMLIKRECIYPLTTLSEFMNNRQDLIEAIKLNWLLGYSDQITLNNLSKGLVSDYDFIQFTPNFNASIPTNDVDILKNLTIIYNKERRTMRRNIDSFIRNMGWIEEEETERLPKKRVTSNKEEVIEKVNNLLDTSSIASSYLSGSISNKSPKSTKSSPSNCSMSMEMSEQESNNSTRVSLLDVPDVIDIDDEKSEVTDCMEVECKKFLKKILNESGDDCGIIAYFDVDGDIRMDVIDEKKLSHVMSCVIEYDMNINKD